MQLTTERRSGFTLIHLSGEFDTYFCTTFLKEIEHLAAAGRKHVALNLRSVSFINSTALGAVIKASRLLAKSDGLLVISRPSNPCREVLYKIGLDRVVPIFTGDEEAGAALLAHQRVSVDELDLLHADDEGVLIFHPLDIERLGHFFAPAKGGSGQTNPVHGHTFGTAWRGVGRLSELSATALGFRWAGGNSGLTPFELGQFLARGIELRVKFRLPLLGRQRFEATAVVVAVQEETGAVAIGTEFLEIDPLTRGAVEQYARDMAFLKAELGDVGAPADETGDRPD